MTSDEFVDKYVDYYKHLEQRFLITRNYVAFSESNYAVYSNEYASLLLAICSELDGLLKEICGYPDKKDRTMYHYKVDIFTVFPHIDDETVKVSYFRNEIQPFKDISDSMIWWKKYNNVKHNRITNIKDANLETVLYSLAAVYVLNRCKLKALDEDRYYFTERSELFRMKGWEDEFRSIFTTKKGDPVLLFENDL